jgi:hypothetical protein
MQVFEGQSFESLYDQDSAATFSDLEFRRCHLQSCALSMARQPNLRSTVRNVQLIGCSQRGCRVDCAILEDVVVDGFKTNGLFQAFGAVFNRVVLRGKIDRLMLSNDVLPSGQLSEEDRQHEIDIFREANTRCYQHVDWALDISQGEFKELDIRGIPARLIRRDPETQIVVTRQRVLRQDWRDLDFHAAITPFSLDLMLQWESPDLVLIAPKRHPKFRSYLEDLRLLQEAGVAEPN